MSGERNPVAVFFGWIMLAAGVLIAGSAGLCSAVFLVMTVGETAASSRGALFGDLPSMLLLVLLFGGIPIAAGVGIGFLGWMIVRKRNG
jgi:hypothetical protein